MKTQTIKTVAIATLFLSISVISSASINKPSCADLKAWAGSYEANQNFEPLPLVELNSLFQDENLIPIFNKSIVEWDRKDFAQLRNWLTACRKQAYAQNDRAEGELFNAALGYYKRALRAINLYLGGPPSARSTFPPEQHKALLKQIQAVPDTQAGIAQLRRIARNSNPKVGLMSRKQIHAYNQAFQHKRRVILAKLADGEAKAEAAKP